MMPSFTEPGETRAADLRSEQAVVDAAYEHLDRMRVKVERLLAEMKGADPDLEWALAAPAGGSDLRGGEALLAELERVRTGEMLDIVATIQPEQDDVFGPGARSRAGTRDHRER